MNDITIASDGTLFAASGFDGMYRSTDGGTTWTTPTTGLDTLHTWPMVIGNTGRIYAGSVERLHISNDNGATWTAVSAGPTSSAVRLITGANSNVYTALRDGSIYVSATAGDTWTAVTTEPTGRYPSSLAFGPDRELYIGSFGRGVYRSVNAVSRTEGATEARLELAAFPNPIASETTLRFILDAPSEVRVSVFDVAGRKVAHLAEGAFASGPHELEWRPDGLASGVYLIRLDAEAASATQRVGGAVAWSGGRRAILRHARYARQLDALHHDLRSASERAGG